MKFKLSTLFVAMLAVACAKTPEESSFPAMEQATVSTAEWRERQLQRTSKYTRGITGFPALTLNHGFNVANIDMDYRDTPRRLMLVRTELPSILIGGHKAFDLWECSWVNLDTDETVYNPKDSDAIIGTFERPFERKPNSSPAAFTMEGTSLPSQVSGVSVYMNSKETP